MILRPLGQCSAAPSQCLPPRRQYGITLIRCSPRSLSTSTGLWLVGVGGMVGMGCCMRLNTCRKCSHWAVSQGQVSPPVQFQSLASARVLCHPSSLFAMSCTCSSPLSVGRRRKCTSQGVPNFLASGRAAHCRPVAATGYRQPFTLSVTVTGLATATVALAAPLQLAVNSTQLH